MSSRNRQPRASLNQDADEERRLWNMIREGAKKIDSMVVCVFSLSSISRILLLSISFHPKEERMSPSQRLFETHE